MIDIESMIQSQRVIWIKRFFKSSNRAGWTLYIQYACLKLQISPADMLRCDFDPENLSISWPLFYYQMLFSWFYFKSTIPHISPWDIRRKVIIFNKDVLIGKLYASHKFLEWFHKGIKQIHDLYDRKGILHPVSYLENKYFII